MELYFGLFLIGLVIGLYDSVVGSGGLVIVTLLSLLNVPTTMAIGTMRGLSLVQEAVSLVAFLRKKLVNINLSMFLGTIAAFFSIIGSLVVFNVPEHSLSVISAVLMVTLALIIPFLHTRTHTARPIYAIREVYKKLTDSPFYDFSKKRALLFAVVFIILGFYGGFYGAGFGTFSLLAFNYIGRMNLLRSAGNSRLVGFLMSLAASTVFFYNGAIDWNVFVPLGGGLIIGSWYGVELAERLGVKYIKVLLTVVVLASAIRVLLNVLY